MSEKADTDAEMSIPERVIEKFREHTEGSYRHFDEQTAEVIRQLYERGMSLCEIADEYDTSPTTVSNIVNRKHAYNDEEE